MKTINAKSLLVFTALIVFLLSACATNKPPNTNSPAANSNQASNANAATIAKDDVEELGKIIKLPFAPEEATYSETNSNEKKLVVVLKFSADDANQIAAQAAKYKTPAPSDVDAENWFPPELVAKSQETGDESLKGVEYAANDFLQPPYTSGRLTRLNDTDYFVLELTAF